MTSRYLIVAAVILAGSVAAWAQQKPFTPPQARKILSHLRAGHPRLVLTNERLAELKQLAKTDKLLAKSVGDVIKQADALARKPELVYHLVGPRLLSVSRDCVNRMYAYGLAWRWTGKKKYLDKARATMLAVGRVQGLAPAALPGHGRDDPRHGDRLRLVLRRTRRADPKDRPRGDRPTRARGRAATPTSTTPGGTKTASTGTRSATWACRSAPWPSPTPTPSRPGKSSRTPSPACPTPWAATPPTAPGARAPATGPTPPATPPTAWRPCKPPSARTSACRTSPAWTMPATSPSTRPARRG